MHWRIPLFLHDGTNTYTTRQENDYYVLHNAAVMGVRQRELPEHARPKRGLVVCEPTDGFTLTRVGYV